LRTDLSVKLYPIVENSRLQKMSRTSSFSKMPGACLTLAKTDYQCGGQFGNFAMLRNRICVPRPLFAD
jgi:hypothetical protein